jgi:tRNA threonylcarbamoyladenosine biosynthesis protein TsaB
MLILAIDTALDACAAAVLDTEAGRLIARESLAMKRGHAEALMPLIARVVKQAGISFAALDRIAVTTGPGSFTGLRVGLSAARGIALAAGKPVVGLTTLTAYAAAVVSESGQHPIISAIDARHDQVYFQVVSGDAGSLIRPRVVPVEEALEASRFGAPLLVGNAANILAAGADRCAAGAGYCLGRLAGRRCRAGHRAGPALLSARSRRQTSNRPAAECIAAAGIMNTWLSSLFGSATAVVEPASLRDAPRLAELHGASFHRGWGEGEFEDMLSQRNTLAHRLRLRSKLVGFAISRIAADEAEILSIAIAPGHRGRGLSRQLLLTHLGHLTGRGVRTVFLEVEENNLPARRLYDRAGFAIAGRRERYYREAGGEQLNALVMRRDLS